MTPPPVGRVPDPEGRVPERPQVLGDAPFEVTPQGGDYERYPPAGLYVLGDVERVQLIGGEELEGVYAEDDVEEALREGQAPRVPPHGVHLILDAGGPDPRQVLRRVYPRVYPPDVDAELPGEEDRRSHPPASEVEDLHPTLQGEDAAQRLGEPETLRAERVVDYPPRIVLGRQGIPLMHQ